MNDQIIAAVDQNGVVKGAVVAQYATMDDLRWWLDWGLTLVMSSGTVTLGQPLPRPLAVPPLPGWHRDENGLKVSDEPER